MGAWAVFAAPLIMGNDVRNLTAAQRAILLHKDLIAINQDPAGATDTCTQQADIAGFSRTVHSTGHAVPASIRDRMQISLVYIFQVYIVILSHVLIME